MTNAPRSCRVTTRHPRALRGVARLTALLLAMTAAGAALTAGATLAAAAITTPFLPVFSQNTTGDIQIRGNTLMTCQAAVAACAPSRNTIGGGAGTNAALNDNAYWMIPVDTDADPATFNSSSSTVNLPAGATVLYAALVWGGRPGAGGTIGGVVGVAAPTPADTNKVKLKAPGQSSYSDLTADSTATDSGNYQSFRDVTSIVQTGGNGSYSVANVQTGQGGDSYAGWGLAIAYSDTSAPPRNLTIFKGYGSVASAQSFDIVVSGFTTPPAGPVRTTLGAVSYEGDLGSTGDQLLLGPDVGSLTNVSDALHASTNVFNSTISDNGIDSSTRNPNYKNQLGFDAATFNLVDKLPNSATSADIRVTSSSETYYPGLITFATELYAPELEATKSVSVVAKAAGNTQAGVLEPGDTLEYTINATNNGLDDAKSIVLTDTVPAGTTYVSGSLTTGGAPLTDASGDDVGSYSSGTRKISVNLGSGATPSAGGKLLIAASASPVTFRVTADANVTNGQNIDNVASFAYAGELTGTVLAGVSNSVTTPAVRHHSALSINKSADLTLVQRGAATTVTYTLTVTNGGPYDEPAASVTDTLPAGAAFGTVTPSSGTCGLPSGQTVTCNLGALVNGGTATVTVRAVLDGSADPATDTATVSGTSVDSNSSNNTATKATAVNTAPVAVADSATTSSGVATITVLGNDSDSDGDPLGVAPAGTAPSRGTVVVNPDKTVTYTASAGQAGSDTFSYTVSDGRSGTATASVTMTIPNTAPDAADDAGAATLGTSVTVPVLGNDTDANIPTLPGQALSVTAVTQPAGGTGVVTTNGTTVTFAPGASFVHGSTTFTYTITDGATGSDTATVTVTMANADAVAATDTAATTCVTAVDVDVLLNDSDPNGDPLTVTGVSGATHGTATIIGSGAATKVHYVPSGGWSGADVLSYSLFDGTSTVSGQLTVTTASCAPVASPFSATVPGGTGSTFTVLSHVTDPDTSAGNLSVVGASGTSHGTVTVNADHVIYTPDPTYAGPDSFTYTASDSDGNTSAATVTLTVLNQAPVAHADATPVPANGSVDITVLGNDTDGNGDSLDVTGVSVPGHGVATLHPDHSVTYTPGAGYLGADSFTYTISDGHGGTDTASVTITVANLAPVAVDDSISLTGAAGGPFTVDALTNDSDPNGDPLTVDSVSAPLHGTAVVHGGKVVYTPNPTYVGPDSFTYTVKDGRGGQSVATVAVTIVNRAPHGVADTHTTPTDTTTIIDVLANDDDPDSEAVAILAAQPTSAHGGTVTVTSGGRLRYVPANGFAGIDTFTYQVVDPRGGTATATVTVTVANAAPVAVDDTTTTHRGTAVVVAILDNDSDPNTPFVDQGLRVTRVKVTRGKATAGITADGRVRVVPIGNYTGPVVVTYTIVDSDGASSTAKLRIMVSATEATHLPARPLHEDAGTAGAASAPVAASALPHTGADIVPVGILGMALMVLGAMACLFATRRREQS